MQKSAQECEKKGLECCGEWRMTNGEVGDAARGVHPRRDEKSAEVIDRQRVERRPSRRRVRNPLKRKDLYVQRAELEMR